MTCFHSGVHIAHSDKIFKTLRKFCVIWSRTTWWLIEINGKSPQCSPIYASNFISVSKLKKRFILVSKLLIMNLCIEMIDHFLFQKKFSFTYKFNRVQIRKQVQFTFKINTFWWKQSTCRIPQAEQGKTTQEKLLFPHFHCSPVLICSSKKANLS